MDKAILHPDRRSPVVSSYLRRRVGVVLSPETTNVLDALGAEPVVVLATLLLWRYSDGGVVALKLLDLEHETREEWTLPEEPSLTLGSLVTRAKTGEVSDGSSYPVILEGSPDKALDLFGEELMEAEAFFWAERKPADSLYLQIDFDSERFEEKTLQGLLDGTAKLVEAAARELERPLEQFDWLPEDHQERLEGWQERCRDYPRDSNIVAEFKRQLERSPEALAVTCGQASWTYRELDRRSDLLAVELQAAGVEPSSIVAFCLPRGLHAVSCMLGILKTGAAYLPLDPAEPERRKRAIMEDSGACRLLTECTLNEIDWERQVPIPQPVALEPDSAAYVMYTSGSTGTPKGVCIEHRGVVCLVKNTRVMRLGESTVMAQLATLAFDAATLEIWGALLNGGRVAVFASQDLTNLGSFFRESGVTETFVTATLLPHLVELGRESLATVRQVLAGGSELSPPHVSDFLRTFPDTELVNAYGPTEGTVMTTYHPIKEMPPDASLVPIGRPLDNSRVLVLDKNLRPVPIGVPGELCLNGDGVARGYLGREELNRSCFPIWQGRRMFRTGDLARWNWKGDLEFLGRMDQQVKLRGFRVEPGEVRVALLQDERVREAEVVLGQVGKDEALIAYLVGCEDVNSVRTRLQSLLPDYMIPAAFIPLQELPLNRNGKVDRARLPAPVTEERAREDRPRTELERLLVEIWCEVLGRDSVTIHQDFFYDLGGHSLLATRVANRIKARIDPDFSPSVLFDERTIAQLAGVIGRSHP